MPKRTSATGSELFIVDNSDTDWKVVRYLHDWCQISKGIDVATGYFEIGSLLALKDEWQKVDAIRILMGNEVSMRTKGAFEQGLTQILQKLDQSLEAEKTKNDFLSGVDAIVEALRTKKIQCRVYRKEKFHAKCYITRARLDVVGAAALVGSSNFTHPGLTENIELNVQITGGPVTVLQEWYEEHWALAEDVTPEILRTVERHTREYSPFEVYARSLHEMYAGRDVTESQWESGAGPRKSVMYPLLAGYQKEAYHQLREIAARWHGAFLCDGVGLGKTFVGLMLIEWLVEFQRKRVALIVPKAARDPVWESNLKKYLPHVRGVYGGLQVFNHSDLGRGGEFEQAWRDVKNRADVIVIDEAHHFRNPGTKGGDVPEGIDPAKPGPRYIPGTGKARPSRYRRLYEVAEGKDVYLLTATPVNNKLLDFLHMIELFSREDPAYFKAAPLGIHSLAGHFRKMERDLERLVESKVQGNGSSAADGEAGAVETNAVEAEQVLVHDALFRKLVVQRSRAYVKQSQERIGAGDILFPERKPPVVAEYRLRATYGDLLKMVEKAFSREKPLFSLAVYYPLAYAKRPKDQTDGEALFEAGRQKQIVRLVRTSFLKRFESSAEAFKRSCHALLIKLLAWVEVHAETPSERRHLDKFKTRHADLVGRVERQRDLFEDPETAEEEDLVPPEMILEAREGRLDREEYDVPAILEETFADLETVADFLKELGKFDPTHDDKLKTLVRLLKSDPALKGQKVLIFSEYMDTAQYLEKQLIAAGLDGVREIDSSTKGDRGQVLRAFSPYYNGTTSGELAERGEEEIRILIATDVLSEGLNLQDACRLINYDLHWNPVRLMQRIGRVDRRMNPQIEAKLLADHPEQKKVRGTVIYWNFLPPEDLNELLTLYSRVTHKTLRISKTFGIEGKKLLTPDDDFDALRDFTEMYDGRTSPDEKLRLEYQQLLKDHPGLEQRLDAFPNRVFSGKAHPSPGARGVFFCFALPAPTASVRDAELFAASWAEEAGETKWYLYDLAKETIADDAPAIAAAVRSTPETPRKTDIPAPTLAEVRARVEKHIKNTYLKSAQAPVGVKPVLKAWMELN